jgi:hypothetical protein
LKENFEKNNAEIVNINILHLHKKLFKFVEMKIKIQGVILLVFSLIGFATEGVSMASIEFFIDASRLGMESF